MQMRSSGYSLLACLAVVALAGLPTGAAADDWDSCEKQSGDLAVAGCSRAIDSHQYTGRDLARLHASRGVAYLAQGDLDHAMADYNESVRLDPTYARAYYDRGITWYRTGELDRAIAAYSEVIRLDPKKPKAYYYRGVAWEKKCSLQEALADFETYSQLVPSDPDGPKSVELVKKVLSAR
jgi:tetratricopeptide (TPR) repeat protein